MSTGRLIGILLVAGAVGVCLLGALVMVPRYTAGELSRTAMLLGLALALVVALPLLGAGVYMTVRGGHEARVDAEAKKQRQLLDMVTARGQVRISDAAVELQAPRDLVRDWLYRLVGLGVFSGYINWDDGMLYSADAAALRELRNCKKCGGEVQLAGKGVVKCPYCGTEYFLT